MPDSMARYIRWSTPSPDCNTSNLSAKHVSNSSHVLNTDWSRVVRRGSDRGKSLSSSASSTLQNTQKSKSKYATSVSTTLDSKHTKTSPFGHQQRYRSPHRIHGADQPLHVDQELDSVSTIPADRWGTNRITPASLYHAEKMSRQSHRVSHRVGNAEEPPRDRLLAKSNALAELSGPTQDEQGTRSLQPASRATTKGTIQGLCPDDKQRVARLVAELSRETRLKNQHLAHLEATQNEFEARLEQLLLEQTQATTENALLRARLTESQQQLSGYKLRLSQLRLDASTNVDVADTTPSNEFGTLQRRPDEVPDGQQSCLEDAATAPQEQAHAGSATMVDTSSGTLHLEQLDVPTTASTRERVDDTRSQCTALPSGSVARALGGTDIRKLPGGTIEDSDMVAEHTGSYSQHNFFVAANGGNGPPLEVSIQGIRYIPAHRDHYLIEGARHADTRDTGRMWTSAHPNTVSQYHTDAPTTQYVHNATHRGASSADPHDGNITAGHGDRNASTFLHNNYSNNNYAHNGYAGNGYTDNGYTDTCYECNIYTDNGHADNGYADNLFRKRPGISSAGDAYGLSGRHAGGTQPNSRDLGHAPGGDGVLHGQSSIGEATGATLHERRVCAGVDAEDGTRSRTGAVPPAQTRGHTHGDATVQVVDSLGTGLDLGAAASEGTGRGTVYGRTWGADGTVSAHTGMHPRHVPRHGRVRGGQDHARFDDTGHERVFDGSRHPPPAASTHGEAALQRNVQATGHPQVGAAYDATSGQLWTDVGTADDCPGANDLDYDLFVADLYGQTSLPPYGQRLVSGGQGTAGSGETGVFHPRNNRHGAFHTGATLGGPYTPVARQPQSMPYAMYPIAMNNSVVDRQTHAPLWNAAVLDQNDVSENSGVDGADRGARVENISTIPTHHGGVAETAHANAEQKGLQRATGSADYASGIALSASHPAMGHTAMHHTVGIGGGYHVPTCTTWSGTGTDGDGMGSRHDPHVPMGTQHGGQERDDTGWTVPSHVPQEARRGNYVLNASLADALDVSSTLNGFV